MYLRQNKKADFNNEQNNNFLMKYFAWEYFRSLLRFQPQIIIDKLVLLKFLNFNNTTF